MHLFESSTVATAIEALIRASSAGNDSAATEAKRDIEKALEEMLEEFQKKSLQPLP
jgi:hypothetical protein